MIGVYRGGLGCNDGVVMGATDWVLWIYCIHDTEMCGHCEETIGDPPGSTMISCQNVHIIVFGNSV